MGQVTLLSIDVNLYKVFSIELREVYLGVKCRVWSLGSLPIREVKEDQRGGGREGGSRKSFCPTKIHLIPQPTQPNALKMARQITKRPKIPNSAHFSDRLSLFDLHKHSNHGQHDFLKPPYENFASIDMC